MRKMPKVRDVIAEIIVGTCPSGRCPKGDDGENIDCEHCKADRIIKMLQGRCYCNVPEELQPKPVCNL